MLWLTMERTDLAEHCSLALRTVHHVSVDQRQGAVPTLVTRELSKFQ